MPKHNLQPNIGTELHLTTQKPAALMSFVLRDFNAGTAAWVVPAYNLLTVALITPGLVRFAPVHIVPGTKGQNVSSMRVYSKYPVRVKLTMFSHAVFNFALCHSLSVKLSRHMCNPLTQTYWSVI